MIGTYETHDGKTVEVHKVNGLYSVFSGQELVQKDLDADAFVRYACWALQAANYKIKCLAKS